MPQHERKTSSPTTNFAILVILLVVAYEVIGWLPLDFDPNQAGVTRTYDSEQVKGALELLGR